MMRSNDLKHWDIRSDLLAQMSRAVETGDISGGLQMAQHGASSLADRKDREAGLFRCLEARLLLSSGEYTKALSAARLATTLLAEFGETDMLAEAYLICGKALIALGKYEDAEIACLDADSLFRRNDNDERRLVAVNQLARICFIRADYKIALRRLLDAVKLADRLDDQKSLAFLWGNLGRVYTFLGNFKKAEDSLQLNMEISEELADDKELAKATMSLGYLYMLQGRYERAAACFDDTEPIVAREKMQREAVILLTYRGELNLRVRAFGEARRLLNDAIYKAKRLAPESSLLVAPLRHLAHLELLCGNYRDASRVGHQALALADSIGEAVEKGAILRILAGVLLAEDDSSASAEAKAVALFGESLGIFDDTSALAEKAETLLAMGETMPGSTRRRLGCLFRAADLFQRLGIDSRYQATQDRINEFGLDGPSDGLTKPDSSPPTIVTVNPRLKQLLRQLTQAASSDMPILLRGETGTGKDLLAEYYHHVTGRSGQFVAINCAAFPDSLLESEMFGYRRGAFTGADGDKEGLFHQADGGTLFLDEIGEMSLTSQAKLLSVIETCRARRLGSTQEELLDLRIVAATNCNLEEMVETGKFRRDLYYRLSVIQFEVPSLEERPEDIPVLLAHFLEKEHVKKPEEALDPALIAEFSSRSWPGNVRELESEVKKLALFSSHKPEDGWSELAGILIPDREDRQTTSLFNQVEEFEKSLIKKALRLSGGNKSEAARSLSIHEATLRAKMKRYNIRVAAAS